MKINRIYKIFVFVVLPVIVLITNLYIVHPIFSGEVTAWRGSIETAYISVATFIKEFFPHISWNPYWYNGYPFHTFYNPFFPFLEVLTSAISGLSILRVYRIITGLAFCFGPVSFYYLVLYLSRSWSAAIPASLAYSLLPSLVYQFTPSAAEVGERLNFPPWRANILSLYGEGPHTSSLVFSPLAIIFFLRALRKPSFQSFLFSAGLIAIVALTNMIGIISLAIILLICLIVENRSSETKDTFLNAIKIFLLTFGLVAFWYNLSFIKLSFFFGQGGSILGSYIGSSPLVLLVVAWIIGMIFVFIKLKGGLQSWFLIIFWTLIFGTVTYFGYVSDRAFLPQPKRYVPYFDMGLYTLLGLVIASIYRRATKVKGIGVLLGMSLVTGVCIYIVYSSLPFIKTSAQMTQSDPEYKSWSEYTNAKWLSENTAGKRIYSTGNTAFWGNSFFPGIVQVKGSLDQAATSKNRDDMQYQVFYGHDPELAINLLKIFNASYILINLPSSSDPYKDYLYPDKFSGLEEVWTHGGDVVYRVPLRDDSFAKVVSLEEAKNLISPVNGADSKAFASYLSWLDEYPQQATMEKINNDQYLINAKISKGQGVLVQMTYSGGWHASMKNGDVSVSKDKLDYLLLKPNKTGDLQISLTHGRSWDIVLGYIITLITIVGIAVYAIIKIKKPKT